VGVLVDTHSHIHDNEHFPDPEAELQFAKENGIEKIFVVGVSPEDWSKAIAFAERFEEVYAICGWHPNYTEDYDAMDMPKLIKYLRHPKLIALGEIGLDYHWEYSPHSVQIKALRDQLRVAEDYNLPVVFHAREAYSDLLDILETMPRRPYLFHCFTGTIEEARRILRLGGYFGCDGPVTYKKAEELRKVFSFIPPHKIVLETDSPYMPPVPYRGKSNRPGYLQHINSVLAELHQMTPDEMAERTRQNVKDFFGI
jgi:TatD DNase family protein